MNKRLFSILAVLLIATLLTSTVYAGGAVKLSGVSFNLASLISKGFASGLGSTDWILELNASGHAGVICTNNGNNDVPGQSSPHVDGKGTQALPGSSQLRKNGRSPFNVEAKPDVEINPIISWSEGGCPNPNWTARVDFVYWDGATILVKDPITQAVVATYKYACSTTKTGSNSTPSTFDDGTVSCTQTYPTK